MGRLSAGVTGRGIKWRLELLATSLDLGWRRVLLRLQVGGGIYRLHVYLL